ncbi:MAG: ABC transporter ATP-binding protein [Nodosilinea sp. WJT8-NPBG4]|jgi:lipopolysaccharide transport system ATP-binding protein|nr:ABC transporter ATP-binding protein [Nodosilinea sp. WJT8-NPBG4]
MSDSVIQVENLGKKYVLGQQQGNSRYVALRDVVADGVKSFSRRLRHPLKHKIRPQQDEFWALKDVSFEVNQGEVVGIIGRNGAGKSTLLKILSRITEPTTGRVRLRGRVASLLEVGTGFHPELTGRENIFLNGAILGMSRVEINRKFDEIVEFAEVSRFLDTPVKRYSSGMYVRLAFAVAAHLEPEILVVDEVLAVGDAAFQKKCLGKMGDVAKQEGRTVLFVSHNMTAVESLCQTALMLSDGQVLFRGDARTAIAKYISETNLVTSGHVDLSTRLTERYGPKQYATLKSLSLLDVDGHCVTTLQMGQPVSFRVAIDFKVPSDSYEIGIAICNLHGVRLHYLISNWENDLNVTIPGCHTIEAFVPAIHLFPGEYSVNVWVKKQGESYDDAVHEATGFAVQESQITNQYAYFERYSTNTQVYTPSRWQIFQDNNLGETVFAKTEQ